MKKGTILLSALLVLWLSARTQAQTNQNTHVIYWQNTATNQVGYWLMNGTAFTSAGYVATGPSTAEWNISAIADLSGDGKPDLIWQNVTSGDVGYWVMSDYFYLGSGTLATGVPPEWRVVAAIDLNGDKNADLLWQNTTSGAVAYWLLSGTVLTETGIIASSTPAGWRIAAATHLGSPQNPVSLIWENVTTGDTAYWVLNRTTLAATGRFSPIYSDPKWQIVAAPDLNGDGQADLIFENTQNNQISYWLLNGSARSYNNDFLTQRPVLDWKVRAVN